MPWNRWYSIKSYIRSALWIVPLVAIALQVVVSRLTDALEAWLVKTGYMVETSSYFGIGPAAVQSVMGVIITLTTSFLVFTFGSLLVAIQVAGGQYTPRIIATTLLRDNALRYTVGLFVITLLFAVRTLTHTTETVYQLSTFIAVTLGWACIVAFLFLIDYAARMLRPVSLVGYIGEQGIAVIESVYPNLVKDPKVSAAPGAKRGPPERTVRHRGTSGIVLAVNLDLLVAEAQRADGVIEFAPQVGDFVAVDEPLFHVYGNAGVIDDDRLRAAVALGPERTLEQNPMFAFRIVTDIALKALSAAINDPTTAVLAIDQLHRLLRAVGRRSMRAEEIGDKKRQLRVIFRTPNWEDFVHITFREIRHYGAGNIQIARRLRAMAENLMQTLPAHRHPALRIELELLDRAIEKQYIFPEDRTLARIPDTQGMGGSDYNKS